jgi:hypothetical protein
MHVAESGISIVLQAEGLLMTSLNIRRVLLVGVLVMALLACGRQPASSVHGFLEYLSALEAVSAAVAAATGYPADHIDVSGNQKHVYVSLIEPQLMNADDATLERTANATVAAVEPMLRQRSEFAAVQTIYIEIYHPSGLATTPSRWHSRNVLEFRRGADQHFALQAP